MPLQFQNQRLHSELDSIRSHSTWLEGELRSKSEELAHVRSTQMSESAQTRANVDMARSERDELSVEADQTRDLLERSQQKIESLSRQLYESRQEATDAKIGSEEELMASRRLVDLQKEQIYRLEQKHTSLAKRMEEMKQLATDAENEDAAMWKEREQQLIDVSRKSLQDQAEDYKQQVQSMQEQIDNANRRCKRAEDGLLLIEGPPATSSGSTRVPLALPPSTNRAGSGASNDDGEEPIGLMALHQRVAEAEDALNAEIVRRKKAEIHVCRIEADIKATAPALVRQRKEYEMGVHKQKELQQRMDNALDEASEARTESRMLLSEVSKLNSKNKELTVDGKALAQQIQDMLIASSTGIDNPSAPRTVSQMQAANQRLLKDYADLKGQVNELEYQLQENDLHQEVEDYKQEVAKLVENQNRQEIMVDSIVQQRDLYRALVNKQDTDLIMGGDDDERSALALVKRQSEQSKSLKEQHEKLSKEYLETKAKMDKMVNEQENASERLSRYETLNEELTKSIDTAKLEISKGAAAAARSEAEASFYKDKVQVLENTQQSNRKEINNVTESKNVLMNMNTKLEEKIMKVQAECSKRIDQFREANSKLRLSEAQTAAAKAAEKRITDESSQLRFELSKQGAVLDHVQRIESSLLSKNNSDIESYKLELDSLKEKLAESEKKTKNDSDDWKGQISDQNIQLKQAESSREKATKEALEAKKECLISLKNATDASKKISALESQLKIAKKKLGESTELHDTESDLQGKLESIAVELEGSKKAVDSWKARAETYEKMAKDNENAVSEMTKASNDTKISFEVDIKKLKEELEHVNSEMTKRKEIITELTNDLSAQRDEREKAVNEVKMQVSLSEAKAEEFKKKSEDVEFRYATLQNDTNVLRSDLAETQCNYERELTLHAAARTDLRTTREDQEKANRMRDNAMEEAATLRSEFNVQKSILEVEKLKREENENTFEKRIESSRAENTLLHSQLEKINDQIEKLTSRNNAETEEGEGEGDKAAEDVSGDEETMKLRHTISELREIVRFVRAEKDAIQDQFDASRRSVERERMKVSTARRAAEEAQAELKVLSESSKAIEDGTAGSGTSMSEKLKSTEEQSRLLGDSNAHLQDQVKALQGNLSNIRQELDVSKSALEPAVNSTKELESDKAALIAEKESLLREIEDWKGRLNSMVSKFNQVDPVEHAKAVKKAEDLEKQLEVMEKEKTNAVNETKRIRSFASRASTQMSQLKQTIESKKKEMEKLTAEKDSLTKLQKESTSKKNMDELKEKLSKLEKEREDGKIQMKGMAESTEKLRGRLRQFQKMIKDLRLQEEGFRKELVEARLKIEQKEAETAKALTELKQEKERNQTPGTAAAAATTIIQTEAKSSVTEPAAAKLTHTTGNIGKQATATTAASTLPKIIIENKEERVLPQVPVGGFKFAPSKTSVATSLSGTTKQQPAAKVVQKQSLPSVQEKKEITKSAIFSKKRPVSEIGDEEIAPRKKTPAAAVKTQKMTAEQINSEDKVAVDDTKEEKDTIPAIPKGQTGTKSPQPPGRRSSGESKEMGMKLKLLERKRKLAIKMEQAKKLVEENKMAAATQKQDEKVSEDAGEPDSKRKKIDVPENTVPTQDTATSKSLTQPTSQPILDPKASSFVPAQTKKTLPVPSQAVSVKKKPEEEKVTETEDGKMEESIDVFGGKSKADAPTTAGVSGISTSSIFGGGNSSRIVFGGGASTGTSSGFGQGSSTPTGSQSFGFGEGTFGSSNTVFGTGSTFGSASAASTAATIIKPSSGFGATTTGSSVPPTLSSSSAFGAGPSTTFLDIKPPGANSIGRQFSFGSSGSSITLPTPAINAAAANPFNAFSSPLPPMSQAFGSGSTTGTDLSGKQFGTTKSLFGTTTTSVGNTTKTTPTTITEEGTKASTEDATKEEEKETEDGEMTAEEESDEEGEICS